MRLFAAINLPAEQRRAAWRAAAPLRSAGIPVRWVSEDALHLTMKFLGEVEDGSVGPIGAALEAALAPIRPFDVVIGTVGAFPDLARPRVLWMGVERSAVLELLANDVEKALQPFGFEPEDRPFHAHLTLGRARRGARPADFRELGHLAAKVDFADSVVVNSVDLMSSVLGPGGPTYTVRRRAHLKGSR